MRTKLPGAGPLLVLALILTFIAAPQLASFYVDWLWFKSVDLEQVFATSFTAQAFWSLAGGALGFLVVFASHLAMVRATRGRALTINFPNQATLQLDVPKHLDRIALVAPALAAFVVGSLFGSSWRTFLFQANATAFGTADPVFGRDISFYVFSLPALEIVGGALLLTLGIALAAAAGLYFLKGALLLTGRGIAAERPAAVHLSVLASLFFLVLAFNTYVGMHAVLYGNTGFVAGATYTDVNARLPLMKPQIALALLASALILASIFVRRGRPLVVAGVGAYLLLAVVGGSVYPTLLHKFVVAPNELVKETPYIERNIAATRQGFNIAAVEERNITGETGLDRADIENNAATIGNIRLWDHRPLLDTFSQVQEIRTYYDFTTVSNDRYLINGEYRQTMLSPRELSSDSIPTKNWINETLTFTHGYGLTLGPVTQVTPEGLPVLLVKDIPPVSTAAEIQVTRPEIYYGKLSSSHVIVNTKSKEFDYPSGEENVFAEYAGGGGVRIDSLLRRLAFTVHFGSLKLLLSNDVTAASRVLYHRNIGERVGRVFPFLRLDSDPHMVVADDGRLVWMYDAYTVSGRYPYSQPVGGVNYIRNSVKVTVDAYDGSLQFYLADPTDPIARTAAKVFPGVLRPLGEMPPDLRRHVRYPLDIFGLQTAVYSTYHMENPQSFYNREDQWEIPVMGAESLREAMEPYYTIMKLPGEKREEFILMIPYNPKNKDNLSAWMVARSDGEAYGKMVVYRFPKDRLVYGPKQIVARINQDTEISRQVSLWDQRGSQVMQGTLLVIPVENSLIYVQPLYLRAETGKIPELKRVIVAYENKIAMEETLERALARIFGTGPTPERAAGAAGAAVPAAAAGQPAAAGELAARAREHYDRALKAQRDGDWARYGEEISRLGEIIKQLR